MDTETRTLLAGSLRELLTEVAAKSGELGPALAELGWNEVLEDDPAEATTLLFREHGRALVGSRALDDVVLAALGAALPPATARRAVLYPMPGHAMDPDDATGGFDGLVLTPPRDVDEFVIPVVDAIALAPAAQATVTAMTTMDASSQWQRVSGKGPLAPVSGSAGMWPGALAAARRALSAEIIGAAEAALELAIAHTSARTQFGRPIAAFQAVRHRLAEAHATLVAASGLLATAWQDGGPWSAAVAKAAAGRAQALVARHALQVCGAVGLTQEHPLHTYVSRAAVLDALLTPHQLLEEELGRELLDGGELLGITEIR
ncbi:acyl-CoA dehydrogenase family protein [Streptomyces sp. NPDC056660]|uniref:acyl-CoA dehydrogenase family protein n=1 Tax=Streptomyces sp. NPDC056660 TaxID=3345897 RepID=UPI003684A33B